MESADKYITALILLGYVAYPGGSPIFRKVDAVIPSDRMGLRTKPRQKAARSGVRISPSYAAPIEPAPMRPIDMAGIRRKCARS